MNIDDMRFPARSGTVSLFRVKPPNVAGAFYPGDSESLRKSVDGFLGAVTARGPTPKAIIAPHAGYQYSGPIAASVYARLRARANEIRKVVLLGPTHYWPVQGAATSSAGAFATPLGNVKVDTEAVARANRLPFVSTIDEAFEREHSLEVHLPFLMRVLPSFQVIPILVGQAAPEEIDQLLETLWGGPETEVVISSDLSHYHDYETAKRMDRTSSDVIESLAYDRLGNEDACGRFAVNGLLRLARRRGINAQTVDLRNSGDTAGPKDRVVGYGAYAFFEDSGARYSITERRQLLGLAASSIRHGLDHGTRKPVELDDYPAALREPRAVFVTLEIDGRLRGCIGSLTATRALAEDVAWNAHASAFSDPRFPALTEEESRRIDIKLSVLSPPEPMNVDSREALLAAVRPGVDGLIIDDDGKRATFLPSVWEQIPRPENFVEQLERKAGWKPGPWPTNARVWRYTTESFG